MSGAGDRPDFRGVVGLSSLGLGKEHFTYSSCVAAEREGQVRGTYLTEHHAIQKNAGLESQLHAFFTSIRRK